MSKGKGADRSATCCSKSILRGEAGHILKMRCRLGPRVLSIVFQHRGEGCCSLQEHLL